MDDGAKQERLQLEKNLKGWLKARSTLNIFDWFDCIGTTVVTTEAAQFRCSTESATTSAFFPSSASGKTNRVVLDDF